MNSAPLERLVSGQACRSRKSRAAGRNLCIVPIEQLDVLRVILDDRERPFYEHRLAGTGIHHPGHVIASAVSGRLVRLPAVSD